MKREYNDSLNSKPIHVLIISDRLISRAKALAEYLHSSENFNVIGLAENENHALELAENHSFDYLIIVGYLQAERNYHVITELQKQKKEFLPVQWAIIDPLITIFCQRYEIPLKFERTLPMADFVSFLNAHKNDSISHGTDEAKNNTLRPSQNVSNRSILRRLFRFHVTEM